MKKVIVLIFWFLLAWAVSILWIITYKILFTEDIKAIEKKQQIIKKYEESKKQKINDQYNYFAILPNIDSETSYTDKFVRYLAKKHSNIKNIVIINKAPEIQKEFLKSFSKKWKYCLWNPIDFKNENCINAWVFDFYKWDNLFSFFNPTKTYFSKKLKNYTIFPLINKYFSKEVRVYYLSIKKENNNFFGTQNILKNLRKQKFKNWDVLYLVLSNFSSYPQDKIAVFHDLKTINTLSSKWFSDIEVECPNCFYAIKQIAHKNEKKYFNVYSREVIKRKKIEETKKMSSLTTKIYWEFEDVKKENLWASFLWNYKVSNFENSFNLTNSYSNKKIYWMFFGDTHFTRWFTYKNNLIHKKDYFKCFYEDFDVKKSLYSNISRMFYSFDYVWVNLETSVWNKDECGINNKQIVFRTEPKYLWDFKDIWINLFNLANNHSYDCNKEGFDATKKWLDFYNLNAYWNPFSGEKNILKKEINGLKVAFMWINTIATIPDFEKYEKTIRNLKKQNYLVIINIHWGVELALRSNEKQRQIARRLVDAGANLIVWHHPHSVQESEVYAWVPIFYSLWNFFFDQHFKNTLRWQWLIYELSEKGIKYSLIDFERDPKQWWIKCDSFK